MFENEIDSVMQTLGYCCGRKYVFHPQVLCCYGKQLCTIPRDATYYSYQNRYVIYMLLKVAHFYPNVVSLCLNMSKEVLNFENQSTWHIGISVARNFDRIPSYWLSCITVQVKTMLNHSWFIVKQSCSIWHSEYVSFCTVKCIWVSVLSDCAACFVAIVNGMYGCDWFCPVLSTSFNLRTIWLFGS